MTDIGSTDALSVTHRRLQVSKAPRSADAQKPLSRWPLRRPRASAKSKALALISAIAIGALVSACGSTSTQNSTAASSAKETPLFHLLPTSIQHSKTIVLATNAEYPTYQYYAHPGGPMVGFEVDIWNAIGKELGVHIEEINTAFNGLIPGVEAGRYQTSMEALGDQANREKQMIFVDTEYGTIGLYALKSTAATGAVTSNPLSLCGKKTAAVVGSNVITQIQIYDSKYCTEHGKSAIPIEVFPDNSGVLEALYSGRVPYIFSDAAAATQIIKSGPVPTVEVPQNDWPKQYLGAIFNLNDGQLARAWLAGLQAAIKDGLYGEIMKKWDLTSVALDDPGINLATKRPLSTTPSYKP
jgi:polar amino acid transport system substrate-binding protein